MKKITDKKHENNNSNDKNDKNKNNDDADEIRCHHDRKKKCDQERIFFT